MTELLFPLFILALVLFIGAAIYLGWETHKKQVAAWAEFAQRHGMQARGLKIEGTYEGYPLTLETRSRGTGRNRYTVAVLHLSLQNALPPEFSLGREGLGDKVLHFLGMEEEQLGDAVFDDYFDLTNLSPPAAAVLRHSSVQKHLYEVARHYFDFKINSGWLEAQRRKVPTTADQLEEFTGPALMLAHTLEEAAKRSNNWKTG